MGCRKAERVPVLKDKLLPEEQELHSVCANLSIPADDKGLREVIAGRNSRAAKVGETIRAELVSNYDATLRLLHVAPDACNARDIILGEISGARYTNVICQGAIENAIKEAKESVGASKNRIWRALDKEGLSSANKLLAEPIRVARLVDLSPALVTASLELAEGSEQMAHDLADNFAWAKGLVRMALNLAAAEIVAWSFDHVVALLERESLVNPAAVARSACAVRLDGSKGTVATRILKRAILRLSLEQWPQAGDKRYPIEEICRSVRNGSACQSMRRAVLTATDPTEELARDIEPRLERDISWAATEAAAAERIRTKLEEATIFCPVSVSEETSGVSEAPCDFQFLNRVASVLLVHNIKASRENRAAIEGHLASIEQRLGARLQDIEQRVQGLQEASAEIKHAVEAQSYENGALSRKNHELLTRLLDCAKANALARFERMSFAAKALELCIGTDNNQDLCGAVQGSSLEGDGRAVNAFCQAKTAKVFGRVVGGAEVVVHKEQLCDVANSELIIEMRTDEAFGACGVVLKDGARSAIQQIFSKPEVNNEQTRVGVFGHADEQRLGAACASRIGRADEEGNVYLSQRRAAQVHALLSEAAGRLQLNPPRGLGNTEPIQRGCTNLPNDSERALCHARNRRVSFAITRDKQFELKVADCKGG